MKFGQSTAKRRAPGPRGHLVWGSLAELRRDPLGLLLRASHDYGDVVRFRFVHVIAHLVNHPDHIRRVLVSHHRNYDKNTRSVGKMRAACGSSLLTASGALWQRHRTLVQPFLRSDQLEQFTPMIVSETQTMLARWREHAGAGQPVEIVSEMMRLLLGIVARMFFSADVRKDVPTIKDSLTVILDETWRRIDRLFDLGALSPRFQRRALRHAISTLDQVVYRILAERRGANCGNDLLACLLRWHDDTGCRLSDTEIHDAALTLLLAGHETTANALAWALYLVSQHAETDSEIRAELPRITAGESLRWELLKCLPGIQRVFAETIRLYPSVWIMERRAIRDDDIGGYRIPAGSMVLISPYVLHRHRAFWPDPEEFHPHRFAGNNDAIAAGAYLPFGAGPRHCVGRELAMFLAPIVLAMVLATFRLQVVPGHRVVAKPGITLRHAFEVKMTLEENPSSDDLNQRSDG